MKNKVILVIACISILIINVIVLQYKPKKENLIQQHEVAIKSDEKIDINTIDASTYQKYTVDVSNFTTHLPLISIETNGQKIPGEARDGSTVEVKVTTFNNNDGKNSLSSNKETEGKARIRYRGNSSMQFDKKGYLMKLIDENGEDREEKIFGMDLHDEWALHGPFLDKTLIRNYMWYNIYSQIDGNAPKVRFCEMILDGKYMGLYLMVETVARSEYGRVQISKYDEKKTASSYLVQLDRELEEDDNKHLENFSKYTRKMEDTEIRDDGSELVIHHGQDLEIKYPPEDIITEDTIKYITEDISEFEKALYSYDYNKKKDGYKSYINFDSFVNYFIINEFTLNNDAGYRSTYLYKDARGKLTLYLWDMNNTFDNFFKEILVNQDFTLKNRVWYNMILKDEKFVNEVINRYNELRKTYLNEEYLLNYIDDTIEYLGPAIERNYTVWGYSFIKENGLLIPTERNLTSYKEAIEQYKNAIHERGTWLDKNIYTLYQFCNEAKTKDYDP